MVAMFNGNPNTTIICPNNSSDEMNLDTFFNELSYLFGSIPKHSVLIIGVNMNIWIGKKLNNKFSLHDLINNNWEHLTDFTLENGLT